MIRRFPSIFILIFIVSGIVLADQSRLSSWVFLAVCLPLCLAGFVAISIHKTAAASFAFGLSLLAFSAFHFAVRCYDVGPNHILNAVEGSRRHHIFGRVADWPDLKADRTEIKIDIDSFPEQGFTTVSGSIILRVSEVTTALQRGDRVEFYGRVYPVRRAASVSGFDYQRHLSMKGVFGVVYLPTMLDVRVDRRNNYGLLTLADRLRDHIRRVLYTNLSPISAALASGFLIGETREIPNDVYYRFRDSGTLHLLAVSGSNVALVVIFFVFLLQPLGLVATKRAVFLLVVILAFAFLSYGEPSVVRASVMASLVILAGLFQRRHDLNNIIAVAALIILLFDPSQLFDIGFQLSFVIAWGLIFILPITTEFFKPVHNRWWYRWLVFPFLVSLVAQICSLGLIGFYFERIPLISPFANLVVVPLVSIGVVGILAVLVAHLILPLFGALMGSWLNLLLEFVLGVVRALGSEDMPALKIIDPSVWTVLFFYLFLVLLVWSLKKKPLRRLVVISVLITVNISLAANILAHSENEGRTKVNLFAIPGGVMAVIQPPGQNSVDLVITGMQKRQYSVVDKVIQPQLVRMGVDSLNSIFVLSAEFDAAVELLNLVDKLTAKHLLVTPPLEPSFHDARTIKPELGELCRLTTLIEVIDTEELKSHVYCLTKRGLVLSTDGSGIIFCDKLSGEYITKRLFFEKKVRFNLVIGSAWYASENDIDDVLSCGFDSIICSKIAQSGLDQDSPHGDVEPVALPEGIYDLNLHGPITLIL